MCTKVLSHTPTLCTHPRPDTLDLAFQSWRCLPSSLMPRRLFSLLGVARIPGGPSLLLQRRWEEGLVSWVSDLSPDPDQALAQVSCHASLFPCRWQVPGAPNTGLPITGKPAGASPTPGNPREAKGGSGSPGARTAQSPWHRGRQGLGRPGITPCRTAAIVLGCLGLKAWWVYR